jgi:hypothetical protein
MDNLIKALTILNKYLDGYNKKYPTSCEHDVLYVQVDYKKISQEDLNELQILGFSPCEDLGNMMSYEYGSC